VNDFENTIPVSTKLVDAIFVHKNIDPQEMNLKQISGISLLAAAHNIISQAKSKENLQLLLNSSYRQLLKAFESVEKGYYAEVLRDFDDIIVMSNILALKKQGYSLETEYLTRAVQPITDRKFSELMGKPSDYNLEQHRLTSFIYDGFEGCLDVQGVAGSGKTSVLYSIARTLRKKSQTTVIVWITRSDELKYEVNKKLGSGCVIPITYVEMCEHFINPETVWGNRYKKLVDKKNIIRQIGIPDQFSSLRNNNQIIFSAEKTFQQIELTIRKFCASYNKYIGKRHLPIYLDSSQQNLVLQFSIIYWKMITNNKFQDISVERYHHVKYVELNKYQVRLRNQIDYLLVDEAQELPASVMNIINYMIGKYSGFQKTATQGTVILGDKFQAMGSFNNWVSEDETNGSEERFVRNRKYLPLSERFGSEISSCASAMLIQGNYGANEARVIGSKREDSRVLEFDWSTVEIGLFSRELPIVFLGLDLWSVFEITQRFIHANIKVYLPTETREALKSLILSALEFRQSGKIYHEEFTVCKSWEDYLSKKNSELLGRVNSMFKRGYQKLDLINTLEKTSKNDNRFHTVSLIEHQKGLESKRVALLPSSNKIIGGELTEIAKKQLANKLYTGITRARSELLLPKGFSLFNF